MVLPLLFACGGRSQLGDPDGGTMLDLDSGPRPDAGFIPDMVLARVVIDGDTLIVSAGSHLRTPDGRPLDGEKIRLIGVDAPEIAHPDAQPPTEADCYGPEAATFTEMTVGGRTIELTYDANNGYRDPYDRLLAYVARNGMVLQEQLLTTGNARAFRQYNHRERDHYIELESAARAQHLGLWSCP